MATKISVALGERSYDIEVGRGNLAHAAEFVRTHGRCTQAIVITDSNVRTLYATRVGQSLAEAGIRADVLTVAAGEESKSVDTAAHLWNECASLGADRKTIIIAVGGGVIGDLAGFVAATYARGLSFLQIPTTLLAQVDSSVGGKVGINLPSAKNIVGAFWQPAGVLIDLQVLATLPDREYRAGLAEVVKYGVILDADLFAYLENNVPKIRTRDPDVLETIVARCIRLKADVVEQDERELAGLRAVLNYGHTFGHAIETVSGYGKYLHGEAVAIGMMCAARLSELLGRTTNELTSRQELLLKAFDLPTSLAGLSDALLLAAMHRDKKAEHGKLRFVLPTRLGHVELVGGIDEKSVLRVLGAVPAN